MVVPYRDEDEKRHLKVMGDLGQIVPLVSFICLVHDLCALYLCPRSNDLYTVSNMLQEWDIRSEQQIEECLRHSDIVYNLVGREYDTKCALTFLFTPRYLVQTHPYQNPDVSPCMM